MDDNFLSEMHSLRIVFVHLGVQSADHLWQNIKFLNRVFPKIKVILIINNKNFYRKVKKMNCEVYFYDQDFEAKVTLDNLVVDSKFRDGFWIYTIERFAALNQWHQKNTKFRVLHLESDNLLLSNFPFKLFNEINHLAWLQHNNTMDSAAIFFSPTSHQTKWLLDQILEQILLSPNTNDMYLLNRISRLNPSKVCLLPTFSSQSIVNSNQQNFDKMSKIKNFDFDGVFDPAAIGVWLTGNDPRNSLGWIKRYKRHFEPSFDPALIKFGFHKKILTGNYLGYEHPIYNLHIHSKQKILFSIYGQLLLKLYVKTSRIGAFKSIYNIFLFRRILNENSVKVEFKPLFLYRVIKILAQSRNSEF